MHEVVIEEIASPPGNPRECIFARTTAIVSADLQTRVTPCQFGGEPDCTQCGCIASMGLAAVGHHRVAGPVTAGQIFTASDRFGKAWQRFQRRLFPKSRIRPGASPFHILAPEMPKEERTSVAP